MVSIMKANGMDYYLRLNGEDYYSRNQATSYWRGQGASFLTLSGQVHPEVLHPLFQGFSPDDCTVALVQNAGSAKRCSAWDITASAPKSVSVLWSLADATIQTQLETIQQHAIEETIAYLEETAASVRTGKGGGQSHKAGLIVAVFDHYSSRNLDPQIHSHCLVVNVGIADGKANALYSPALYASKMEAGALYRASLAAQLQRDLGLEIERRGDLFEVKGVPQSLMRAFSSRRKTILEVLEERDWRSPKAAAAVTLMTRPPKQTVDQETLRSHWQEVGRSFGFNTPEVISLLHTTPAPPLLETVKEEVLDAAKARLAHLTTFTEKDLIRSLALEAPGRWLGIPEIEELRRELLYSCDVAGISRTHDLLYVLTDEQDKHRLAPSLEQPSASLEPDEELEIEWDTL